MAILPRAAHGDTIPVTKVERAYQGKGEARHEVGSKLTGLLLFDGCAQVPITIPGLDISKLPSPDIVTERNLKMQFLVARFRDLEISYRGGEFLNLNPPAAPAK